MNAEATLPRAQTVAPRPRRPLPALILKWFGIGCLMIAAGLGGYIGWLLWGTGLTTKAAQSDLKQTFTHVVDTKDPAQAPPAGAPAPLRGSAYAELIIPRIDLDLIVVQGTDEESLKKGPGHYPETADPWDPTGPRRHRRPPDHVPGAVLPPGLDAGRRPDHPSGPSTERSTTSSRTCSLIQEAGSGVVLTQTPTPTLVLTTCNPRYSSSERLIVTADRV